MVPWSTPAFVGDAVRQYTNQSPAQPVQAWKAKQGVLAHEPSEILTDEIMQTDVVCLSKKIGSLACEEHVETKSRTLRFESRLSVNIRL
jgi:hypothetical protein